MDGAGREGEGYLLHLGWLAIDVNNPKGVILIFEVQCERLRSYFDCLQQGRLPKAESYLFLFL